MQDIPENLVQRIKEAFLQGNYILSSHAFDRMTERRFDSFDIRAGVLQGEAIEIREIELETIVLFNGFSTKNKPIHVSVAERLKAGKKHLVVTVYEPTLDQWQSGFRMRRGGAA